MIDKDSDLTFEVVTKNGSTFNLRIRWWAFWGPIVLAAGLVLGKCTGVF